MKGKQVFLCLHFSYSLLESLMEHSMPSKVFHPVSPGNLSIGFPSNPHSLAYTKNASSSLTVRQLFVH